MDSHYLTQSFRSMLTPLAYFPVGEEAKAQWSLRNTSLYSNSYNLCVLRVSAP